MIFKEHSHSSSSVSWLLAADRKAGDSKEGLAGEELADRLLRDENATAAKGSMTSEDGRTDKVALTTDEKFELLSAYLDDEVTAEERCLVEHWIACDPDIKSDYEKQLRLRAAIEAFLSE